MGRAIFDTECRHARPLRWQAPGYVDMMSSSPCCSSPVSANVLAGRLQLQLSVCTAVVFDLVGRT